MVLLTLEMLSKGLIKPYLKSLMGLIHAFAFLEMIQKGFHAGVTSLSSHCVEALNVNSSKERILHAFYVSGLTLQKKLQKLQKFTLLNNSFLSIVTCVLCPWFLLVFLQVYQSQSSFWVRMKTLQIAILAISILFQAKVRSQETLETLSKKTGEWYYRGWVPCAKLDWNETTTMNKGKLIEFSVWDFGLSRLSWVPLDVLHWVWGAKMRNHQTRA